MPTKGLIIFVRNPELGKVKTRLAREAGDQKALDIYIALLDHTRKVCLQFNVNKYVFYQGEINNQDDWDCLIFNKQLQTEGDLGKKMMSAFDYVLSREEKAVIIGSDCPQISTQIIEKAFESLSTSDIVIGPSVDGGYYLLGMKNVHPFLFENMEWSTSEVFSETKKRIEHLGLTSTVIDRLSDVDYLKDWEQYGWEI